VERPPKVLAPIDSGYPVSATLRGDPKAVLAELPPEEQLCCIVCRPILSERLRELARGLVQAGVNWDRFVKLASRHRIVSLAYHHAFDMFSGVVPRDTFKRLRAHAAAYAKKAEAMARELTAVHGLLAGAGIRAVPLKGPVLISRIWGESRWGVYHDLDFLVKPEDARLAVDVLLQRGYRLRNDAVPALSQRNPRREHLELVRDHELGFPLIIDLHHPLMEREWIGRAGNMKDLWERLQTSDFAGSAFWQLPDDWNLALLSLHTLQHRFKSLYWTAELHGLSQICASAWPEALRRAQDIGAYREVILTRRVCDMILGEGQATCRGVPRITAQLAESPFKPLESRPSLHRLQLAIRQGPWEKIAYVLSVFFVPTQGDFAAFPLPSWLKPAYYLIRPIRLIVTYLISFPVAASWRFARGRLRDLGDSRPKGGR